MHGNLISKEKKYSITFYENVRVKRVESYKDYNKCEDSVPEEDEF